MTNRSPVIACEPLDDLIARLRSQSDTKRVLSPQDAAKVKRALDLIQEAQNTMADACRELCSVKGMGEAYSLACQMHRNIKAHWYEVNDHRQTAETDLYNALEATR